MVKAYFSSRNFRDAVRYLQQSQYKKVVTYEEHSRTRNYFLLCFAIGNGVRSGAVKNLTLKSFEEAAHQKSSKGNHLFYVGI
jgi:integrase